MPTSPGVFPGQRSTTSGSAANAGMITNQRTSSEAAKATRFTVEVPSGRRRRFSNSRSIYDFRNACDWQFAVERVGLGGGVRPGGGDSYRRALLDESGVQDLGDDNGGRAGGDLIQETTTPTTEPSTPLDHPGEARACAVLEPDGIGKG